MSGRRENFYRRDPGKALAGMAAMTLEERGVYNTLLELSRVFDPLPGGNQFIAPWCGAPATKVERILQSLSDRRVILRTTSEQAGASIVLMKPPICDDSARSPLSKIIREFVLNRDDYTCGYCGSFIGPYEVDHIHPVSRGGSDEFDNLICSCVSCNRSKGAKLVSEWGSP
jgi:hypothetical protein